MTTNETEVFIDYIVGLHHHGHKLEARAVLKALEEAADLDTKGMNALYLKISKCERRVGFRPHGSNGRMTAVMERELYAIENGGAK